MASRSLNEGWFARTVILLLEYDRGGALGLVLNRPSRFPVGRLLDNLAGTPQGNHRAWRGGPVSRERIFVLMRRDEGPEDAVAVLPQLWAATRGESVTLAVEENWDETRWRVMYGYSGWSPGQLDGEIARGDWEVHEASSETLFTTAPDALWQHFTGGGPGQWVHHPPAAHDGHAVHGVTDARQPPSPPTVPGSRAS